MLCLAETLYSIATTPDHWSNDLTEDTHVHTHVAPIVNAVFTKDKRFTYSWYNELNVYLRSKK